MSHEIVPLRETGDSYSRLRSIIDEGKLGCGTRSAILQLSMMFRSFLIRITLNLPLTRYPQPLCARVKYELLHRSLF
jgi:hypothetical protein